MASPTTNQAVSASAAVRPAQKTNLPAGLHSGNSTGRPQGQPH